jgi:predicted transcriptional regulator with HTH domain
MKQEEVKRIILPYSQNELLRKLMELIYENEEFAVLMLIEANEKYGGIKKLGRYASRSTLYRLIFREVVKTNGERRFHLTEKGREVIEKNEYREFKRKFRELASMILNAEIPLPRNMSYPRYMIVLAGKGKL